MASATGSPVHPVPHRTVPRTTCRPPPTALYHRQRSVILLWVESRTGADRRSRSGRRGPGTARDARATASNHAPAGTTHRIAIRGTAVRRLLAAICEKDHNVGRRRHELLHHFHQLAGVCVIALHVNCSVIVAGLFRKLNELIEFSFNPSMPIFSGRGLGPRPRQGSAPGWRP